MGLQEDYVLGPSASNLSVEEGLQPTSSATCKPNLLRNVFGTVCWSLRADFDRDRLGRIFELFSAVETWTLIAPPRGVNNVQQARQPATELTACHKILLGYVLFLSRQVACDDLGRVCRCFIQTWCRCGAVIKSPFDVQALPRYVCCYLHGGPQRRSSQPSAAQSRPHRASRHIQVRGTTREMM